ncbi:MAG: hypothetical protein QOC60_547 [Frankiaceae bacterium]|jgi:hypothetical protein|nr:hypothetical protein [Frankiaceae bacterium]
MEKLTAWLTGRLPDDWFDGSPEVTVDKEEITIVGWLTAPDLAEDADAPAHRASELGRIKRFREDTRERRMQIDNEAQHHFGRSIAWGAECGETRQVFTNMSVPVMTRLRQPDRVVLDTLVDAGVARSRSDALAWCVRLVGQHESDWLQSMKDALVGVQQARAAGPSN